MDPELRAYLERDDVRRVADDVMGQGASDSMLIPTVNIGTIRGMISVSSFRFQKADRSRILTRWDQGKHYTIVLHMGSRHPPADWSE